MNSVGRVGGNGEDQADPKVNLEEGTFPGSFASASLLRAWYPQGQGRGGGGSWLARLRGAGVRAADAAGPVGRC